MSQTTVENNHLAFCTIVSKNYLSQARVLAETVKKHHPESSFFLLLSDRIDGYFDPSLEAFPIFELEQLPIEEIKRCCFYYNVVELNTAVKPYFLEYLFKEFSLTKLIYLDPDIALFNRLTALECALNDHDMVLTPHMLSPYPDEIFHPEEKDILVAGSYNLGFVGLKNSSATMEMLKWWQKRLYRFCLFDVAQGYHVDQKWMDFIPCFYDKVFILRDPTYNVAYWNLHERTITMQNEDLQINGKPCSFFHFSGYNPLQSQKISKHQNRFQMSKIGEGRKAFEWYKGKLLAQDFVDINQWPYAFGFYDNGEPISKTQREVYWSLNGAVGVFGNPFETYKKNSFYTWFKKYRGLHRCFDGGFKKDWGLNISGYFNAETGIGNAVRSTVHSVIKAEIPFVLNNVKDAASANKDETFTDFTSDQRYLYNLIHVNADQVSSFASSKGLEYFYNRYNIGFWNWELEQFPEEWLDAFKYFNEVWAPSKYTQKSLQGVSSKPVRWVPYAIEVPKIPEHLSLDYFGIPKDKFIFFFSFDYRSFVERKNPWGAIQAFIQAFEGNQDVLLLIKTNHIGVDAEGAERMQKLCAKHGNIQFINKTLPHLELYALMHLCDAFVSLHRAEGYGLHIFEAMAYGKPVIATGYSSNMDYMNQDNSFVVDYQLIDIDRDYGPYRKGWKWADPNINHAAQLMKQAYENPELCRQIGAKAKQTIETELSTARVGQMIKEQLGELILNHKPANSLVSLENLYEENHPMRKEIFKMSNYFVKPGRKRVQRICYRKLKSMFLKIKTRLAS